MASSKVYVIISNAVGVAEKRMGASSSTAVLYVEISHMELLIVTIPCRGVFLPKESVRMRSAMMIKEGG